MYLYTCIKNHQGFLCVQRQPNIKIHINTLGVLTAHTQTVQYVLNMLFKNERQENEKNQQATTALCSVVYFYCCHIDSNVQNV